MEKTLYLLEMGMNDNEIKTDIHNHRIRTLENIDIDFHGKNYNMFFEFTQGSHRNYRTISKTTGKPLKKAVEEIILKDGIYLDTQFEKEETDKDGFKWFSSWRLSALEHEVFTKHFDYSRKSILEIINSYSIEKYDKVVLVEEETTRIINEIGGFREKDIIKKRDFQTEGDFYFEVKDWNDKRKIVRVNRQEWEQIDKESRKLIVTSFVDVDILNKKIVG